MKRIRIAIDGAEVFLMLDGQRIAKRQHRRWVSLVAGVSAVDRDLGDDISKITVEIAPVTRH